MRIKRRYRVLLIVLASLVLLGGLGVVYYHGEWWFPTLYSMRRTANPDLTPTDVALGEGMTLDALLAREDVSYSTCMMLVNATYPLPTDYVPALVEYNGAKMHPSMLSPYISLRDDVQAKTGVRIYVASDYRTAEEQAAIGQTSQEGIAAAVGCSEHEAGLALDVYAPYYAGMLFLRSRAGRTVNRTCADYGFILRYPMGKENVTGIAYEPWHLRYVGQPHARIMTESALTLEEYVALLSPDVWYQSGEYLIARLSPDNLSLPTVFSHCEISPDNTGYYIVTVRI